MKNMLSKKKKKKKKSSRSARINDRSQDKNYHKTGRTKSGRNSRSGTGRSSRSNDRGGLTTNANATVTPRYGLTPVVTPRVQPSGDDSKNDEVNLTEGEIDAAAAAAQNAPNTDQEPQREVRVPLVYTIQYYIQSSRYIYIYIYIYTIIVVAFKYSTVYIFLVS